MDDHRCKDIRDGPNQVSMFKKVLIANRGAIATRIIRTLNKLNITSVAVYAESDQESLHVRNADAAYSLGSGNASETYLNIEKIIELAKQTNADAIHPGYGFLSENAEFVRLCEENNITFIGPTTEQIRIFGLKHEARALAEKAHVPLAPGSDLLQSIEDAIDIAQQIGYPVMLKSTAGGGGIGMQLCHTEAEMVSAFDSVKRLSSHNFSNDGIFLEKYIANARHIEVQVFGDGNGQALAIGERDCSSQRRNQKVVEECPAPNLTHEVRQQLYTTAESLLASVNYRNAGTVEFIYDSDEKTFYFLEVNTRLQVEHGVTEAVYDIDLVEWMIALASGEDINLAQKRNQLTPRGHAVQVRIYAEDPYQNFQPSPGLLSKVSFPEKSNIRIDHWIESGMEISPYFDPMIAKVIVHEHDRPTAFSQLTETLNEIELYGSQTNLPYLIELSQDPILLKGEMTTRYLNEFNCQPCRIDVLSGGTQTTIQDYPGRRGYWDVGVPPSGPFDNQSFRLGNYLLGNHDNAAGLEITMQGPKLVFSCDSQIVISGAQIEAKLDNKSIPLWTVIPVKANQCLDLGRIKDKGARSYLCIKQGIHCPLYLGSRATFTLGQFGGHNGRALKTGDTLNITECAQAITAQALPIAHQPKIDNTWQIKVIYGPHGAPDFFTQDDIDTFFSYPWEVHYNSSRTGIRLIGPKPQWARKNGGEAGLHPSNIHDNAYAFGTVDFTGDMPVILGPDGPSLGGFVCPATVIQADLWKLGQLRAGDRIQFIPVSLETASELEAKQLNSINQLILAEHSYESTPITTPILDQTSVEETGIEITYRAAGDHFLLVEYGEQALDIELRFRAHTLMQWLQASPQPGIKELTPGIRSLQVHYDSQIISYKRLIEYLKSGEAYLLTQLDQLKVPSRIVHIPLSWNDEACQLAIEKYDQSVRKNAPWCPSNLEFIRRINGLNSIDEVKDIVFNASYLVMGLGDVYLGAPVSTPIDPRHRLVTTKYNPARTWTAENSVGIGGSYMCVYGMEGPGGYQFVGRTLQMWNRYRKTNEFTQPWLLRFFDQIRFYEVSSDELKDIRKSFPLGTYPIKIEESEFSLTEYNNYIAENQTSINEFQTKRENAFAAELAQWHRTGQFNYQAEEADTVEQIQDWPDDHTAIDSSISGSVWQNQVVVGDCVKEGQVLMILESMKMEIPVVASISGTVTHVLLDGGQRVSAGQPLVVIKD